MQKKVSKESCSKINPIGGQALIEGIFMRSKDKMGIANRLPDGRIKVIRRKFKSITQKDKILNMPIIRGVVMLFEILFVGSKLLIYSANLQLKEDEQESMSTMAVIFTILFALLFALVLFKFFPLLITKLLSSSLAINNQIIFNLVDGILRIVMFLIYLIIITQMKDVYRVLQYHGAEHKTVHCYEHKETLTVENVRKYSTLHRRCGTAFLLYNFFLSILVFSLIPVKLSLIKLFLFRLPLLIPIAGISYELIRLSSKTNNLFVRALIAPGLWLQKLTTKEPDDSQIEVAIKALQAAK